MSTREVARELEVPQRTVADWAQVSEKPRPSVSAHPPLDHPALKKPMSKEELKELIEQLQDMIK